MISGCKDKSTQQQPDTFQLLKVSADQTTLSGSQTNTGISVTAIFYINFSVSVDQTTVQNGIRLTYSDSDDDIQILTIKQIFL